MPIQCVYIYSMPDSLRYLGRQGEFPELGSLSLSLLLSTYSRVISLLSLCIPSIYFYPLVSIPLQGL